MTDARDEVDRLVGRLRVTTPDPLEKGNHRLRRYAVERLEAATTIEALLQRAEKAERDAENARSILNSAYAAGYLQAECGLPKHKDAEAALTEARALIAAAWEAGRDAMRKAIIARFEISPITVGGTTVYGHSPILAAPLLHQIDALTPPADASAALTARLDAEWNAAIETAAKVTRDRRQGWLSPYIAARRRGAKP